MQAATGFLIILNTLNPAFSAHFLYLNLDTYIKDKVKLRIFLDTLKTRFVPF